MIIICGFDLLRADFAVRRGGQREHLVSGRFDRAGLVDVDVPGFGAQRALVRAQRGGDHGRVRLRAADEEVHVDVVPPAGGADLRARRSADFVLAVARRLQEIRLRKPLENLRVAALCIIAVEIDHGFLPFVSHTI